MVAVAAGEGFGELAVGMLEFFFWYWYGRREWTVWRGGREGDLPRGGRCGNGILFFLCLWFLRAWLDTQVRHMTVNGRNYGGGLTLAVFALAKTIDLLLGIRIHMVLGLFQDLTGVA